MTRKQFIHDALAILLGLPAFVYALALAGHAFGY